MCDSVLLSSFISLYTPYSVKFGHLILRKIINFVVTKRHILTLKCTKFNFGRWGSVQDPAVGTYSAPSDPVAGLKWVYFGFEERERGREERRGGDPKGWFTLPGVWNPDKYPAWRRDQVVLLRLSLTVLCQALSSMCCDDQWNCSYFRLLFAVVVQHTSHLDLPRTVQSQSYSYLSSDVMMSCLCALHICAVRTKRPIKTSLLHYNSVGGATV